MDREVVFKGTFIEVAVDQVPALLDEVEDGKTLVGLLLLLRR